MVSAPDVESTWRPGRPVDLLATLSVLVRGGADPSHRLTADGQLWRVCRTPQGAATLHLRVRAGDVEAHAWGAGAGWAVDGVPDLLGASDDARGFEPQHDVLVQALRRRPGWRVPRTRLVMEALAPAAFEQKVTGQEAFAGWRRMLLRFGEVAPGPAGEAGMRVPPSAAQWAAVPSWAWLQAGVDGARSATVVRAARVAGRLEQTLDLSTADAERRLRAVPGVGVWTAAEVRQRAHGDADAVSFGDFHVPGEIGLALTGNRVDDDGLAELLEPYRPHRYRVQRLLQLEAPRRGRRAPRPTPRFHLPVR
ncbi:DNA-3-methyladenine glycosylase family protein [Angustibacter luteus]|uniref:DNA-3-methyladenine glycosylase family protein n=1 Tax=Angustibacter luteus TaxID=658456 RepID=A0ABW1JGB6_9ACTN